MGFIINEDYELPGIGITMSGVYATIEANYKVFRTPGEPREYWASARITYYRDFAYYQTGGTPLTAVGVRVMLNDIDNDNPLALLYAEAKTPHTLVTDV